MRTERDTLGPVQVPDDALYGAQTQRAVENYPISGLREHPAFIRAFIYLKKAAALANSELGAMDEKLAAAIAASCDDILANEGAYRQHFVVDVFQAGAGTSFNMNMNEVLANLANVKLGGRIGQYKPIHPNDHVNMAQSTNDVVPAAIRIAALILLDQLFPALDQLTAAFDERGDAFRDVIKSGRTHLQDAVPVTLGQEFKAYAAATRRSTQLMRDAARELQVLGIGGTATGTGINTPFGYRFAVVRYLRDFTGLDLIASDDLREAMQSSLPVVAVSAAYRNLALELTRIMNDLRLLASGPQTGLAEIILPAVQPGSSIMPGKVNPSMLECMNQVLFHIIGADTAIAYAAQAGQLELNVMMPLMAFEITFSIEILKNYLPVFIDKCIKGIEADRARCEAYYVSSPSLATALNPIIGYTAAAEIAKESAKSGKPIPELLRERKLLDEQKIREIFTPEFLAGQADRKA
ncbi:MAG TPA: aspartate ammonia-lyase [Thermoanaerobaculia bacterium]|nr:aspartate ammonia-lyase [Thermoanaerobaculia bacterium]